MSPDIASPNGLQGSAPGYVQLEGIHHITCITADAQANLKFYANLLGLRLVKKTVNFDAPEYYHLYYGDETGSPGSLLTFFEFPGAVRGRPGAGMIHRIEWRVGSEAALDFWAERLSAHGCELRRDGACARFCDFEGLEHELVVVRRLRKPLHADHPEIPEDFALQGFNGVRAYATAPASSVPLFRDALGFEPEDDGSVWMINGETNHASYVFDLAPEAAGIQGAGSVHHVAWATRDSEQEHWRTAIAEVGLHPTGVLDRTYFRSIYFREPNGVLFEIATLSPGFAVDEDQAHLGEKLKLPERHEAIRKRLEHSLSPLTNPREHSVSS